MRLVRLGCAVALAAMAWSWSPAGADSWDDFKAGVEAQERGDHAAAVRLLQRAIAEKGEESSTVFRRYLPHYHLGLSQAALGDCRAAVASFDESRRQGKNTRDREVQAMQAARSRCEAVVERGDGLVVRIEDELDAANAALDTIESLARAPVLRSAWRKGRPSYAERQTTARTKVAGLRENLANGRRLPDLELLERTLEESKTQKDSVVALRKEAQQLFDEVRAAADQRLADLQSLVTTAQRDVRFVAGLGVSSPRLAEATRSLESALERAAGIELGTPEEEVEAVAEAIRKELGTLRREARQPPEDLRQIAESVLAGRYGEALERLAAATFAEPRAEGHACLLRAAATWGRDREAGAGDSASRQVIEECFARTRMPTVVERAFSPAFVALVREVEGASTPTP
jgi:hypothetical protein